MKKPELIGVDKPKLIGIKSRKQAVTAEEKELDFQDQLDDFIEDESYFKKYDDFDLIQDGILVRVFEYIPNKDWDPEDNLELTSVVLVEDEKGNLMPARRLMDKAVYNFVKIIKVSEKLKEDPRYVVGDVYTVPPEDVLGEDDNPKFLHTLNTFGKSGTQGILGHVPDDMRQKLPNIEIHWGRYMFAHPRNRRPDSDDRLTFIIPPAKLKARIK